MTIVASWSGAGLTDGTSVGTGTTGTGDTAFDTVTASTFTVDTTGLHSPRIKVDQQAATEAQLIWDDTTLGTLGAHAVRMYVELSAWPSGNARLLHAYDSTNALQWWMDVTSAGILRLRNAGGSAVDTSASGLPTSDEFRIEVVGDGTGNLTVNLYDGDGTTAFDTLTGTGLGTTVQQIRFVTPSTSPTWPTLWVDELAVANTAAEIGPVVSPVPSGDGTITATSALAGVGTKTGIGTGAITATSAASGAGTKHASGTGSITATSTLSGTGRGRTPGPRVELNLGGTWTDVKPYVRYDSAVKITRGQKSEGKSNLDNATCDLTLDNSDGRFSPRHPLSPYYGLLGRNTPIRVSLPADLAYAQLRTTGTASRVTCPTATALNVTDLDARIDLDVTAWGGGNMCGKYHYPSDASWFLDLSSTGHISLVWTPDGTDANRLLATSTVPLPAGKGRRAIRATLDTDNGAGGYTAAFYTADTIDGAWTQLGDEVTGAATTTIYASGADVEIGDISTVGGSGPDARLYAFELYDGIDGTLVASPDFTVQAPGAGTFSDAQGNTWTVGAGAVLDDRDYRFHGEVAEWPPKRDISGADATVSIKAAGISRRLKQGQATLRSAMFREFANPARQNIIAYWPCEDGKEATQVASSGGGVSPARVTGTPSLGNYDEWTASDPIPTMEAGTIAGPVPVTAFTGETSIRLFVFAESGSVTAETSLLHLRASGTVAMWDVRITSAGKLRTRAYDRDGTSLLDDTSSSTLFGAGFTILDLELVQDGSDIDWKTLVLDITNTDTISDTIPGWSRSGTVTGKTLGIPRIVTVGRDQGLTGVRVGHLAVADDISAYLATSSAIAAHNGEAPVARMSRLCTEEEIEFLAVDVVAAADIVTMGDQPNKSLLDLLQECADSDGGILFEPRDMLGFGYRTRRSMVNQDPMLSLSCAAHELNDVLAPTDDDQGIFNDITVKREAGSEVRVEQTTGPLSTAAPEDGGAGRYDTKVTLSLTDDGQLADQASWRLHFGTVDEARYPKVKVHLASSEFTDELRAAALAVDVGDRLVITDPSPDLPPDDISQIVIGYSEVIDQFEHVITYVCQPESPWHVAVRDDAALGRRDSPDSAIAAAVDSDDTSWSVAAPSVLWTTAAGDVPFDVMAGGERVTVTAISGASSPQTFTVTRSVNGVSKSHDSGTQVRLAGPVVRAL